MYTIKQIPSQDTFAVRQPVLRPGKPVDSCIFEGDDLETTTHFGIYADDDIKGCVSVFQSASEEFPEENQFQMRGMAVVESHQKKGLGEMLVNEAEKYVQEMHASILWFNARESAIGFYKKMGYKVNGNEFDIPGVGTHYIMYKVFEN